MKKVGLSIISLFVVLILSGCSNNSNDVLKCSGISKGNNMNANAEIEYIFENSKLTKANIKTTFQDITVSNLASTWDMYKEQFTNQNSPVEEVGFKRTVSSDDTNYTFTVNIEVDFNTISKETMEKYGISDYTEKTYDEIKEETTKDGVLSCE